MNSSENIWPYIHMKWWLQQQNSRRFKMYPSYIAIFPQTKFLHCSTPTDFVSETKWDRIDINVINVQKINKKMGKMGIVFREITLSRYKMY